MNQNAIQSIMCCTPWRIWSFVINLSSMPRPCLSIWILCWISPTTTWWWMRKVILWWGKYGVTWDGTNSSCWLCINFVTKLCMTLFCCAYSLALSCWKFGSSSVWPGAYTNENESCDLVIIYSTAIIISTSLSLRVVTVQFYGCFLFNTSLLS